MRVLIVKMSSLGDVVHTLPALTDAAAALPGIRFDWVVEEAFAEIPTWHPAVDNVIPIALRRWRKRPFTMWYSDEWRSCRNRLRSEPYDAVIDAQGLLKSAFIARTARGTRYGYDRDSAREGLASLAYHQGIAVAREQHAVERTRQLFASALAYPVPQERGDYGVRANLQAQSRNESSDLLFFHGTAREEKLWPADHWFSLAELATTAGYRVWLPWGSDAERARADAIAAQVNGAEVLPRLDLLGLAGMLLDVDGAVAVDTGLGHLAAALDVPTVSLYGPTRTALIGAYGGNQVHIQSPLGRDDTDDPAAMMASIQPAAVWAKLKTILPVGAMQ
ncbi:MAG: lipopolysaccharide heptosyltransferase I [Pseudomonadota bacterium]